MTSRPDSTVLYGFRAFLERQGFCKPHVVRVTEGLFPGQRYAVSFFDEFEGKEKCLSLTTYDMRCITHANDVFWRFLK